MQKIPTVFKRDPENMRLLLPEVHPDCEWVFAGEGTPTRKYDGTCCMLDENGQWWARREVGAGKTPPDNFLTVEHDRNTDKTVGWEPIEQSAFAKWHGQVVTADLAPGTYELCGPKVNGNPEGFETHVLIRHADAEVLDLPLEPGNSESDHEYLILSEWLAAAPYEGIVWHHPDGRMAKLKRRDFPK